MRPNKYLILIIFSISIAVPVAIFMAAPFLKTGEQRPHSPVTTPLFETIATPFPHAPNMQKTHPGFPGAAAIDIDNDGRDEIFLGSDGVRPHALLAWRNGRLIDISPSLFPPNIGITHSALSLDMNKDRRVDLVIAGPDGIVIWLNRATGFEAHPVAVPFPAGATALSIIAGDYDRDGRADLYVSLLQSTQNLHLSHTPPPNVANPGNLNILLHNEGDMRFRNVTADAGVAMDGNILASAFVDLDRDGWMDLVLARNGGQIRIFKNNGQGHFTPEPPYGIYDATGFWFGVSFGDLHRSGYPDLLFTNMGNAARALLKDPGQKLDDLPRQPWLLLRNAKKMRFTDTTQSAGLMTSAFSWNALFEDINLDGVLDMLVTQNQVHPFKRQVQTLPGRIWLGDGTDSPHFYPMPLPAAPQDFGNTPLIVDFDGDGRNDILWINEDGSLKAQRNRTPGQFISARLPDAPENIGARIRLEGVASSALFVTVGGDLTPDRTTQLSFGLAKDARPQAILIDWPNGRTARIAAPPLNHPLILDMYGMEE